MPSRVCVIGAGPSGMAALYHFSQVGKGPTEVTCYEKQVACGGQWNYTWRTGTDAHGERVHNSFYHNLWTNVPKETMEIPTYTFDKHFGKPTPSYAPRPAILDYFKGRFKTADQDLSEYIRLNTAVTGVTYNKATDDFTVKTRDLSKEEDNPSETFQYVVVASGIFSVPNIPDIEGMETFKGRVLHSRDFRHAEEYVGKRVVLVGSHFSAEDLAIQCIKYGAAHATVTWRTRPTPNKKWPTGVEERPQLVHVKDNTVRFKDGSTAEADVIIYCTGYRNQFPFLPDTLRIKEPFSCLLPAGLYKGIVWLGDGNRKLLYIGATAPVVGAPKLEMQAIWTVRYITGINSYRKQDTRPVGHILESPEELARHLEEWLKYQATVVNEDDMVAFSSKYATMLKDDLGYDVLDMPKLSAMLSTGLHRMREDIMGYRNDQYTSMYTGHVGKKLTNPWSALLEESLDDFLL